MYIVEYVCSEKLSRRDIYNRMIMTISRYILTMNEKKKEVSARLTTEGTKHEYNLLS